MTGCLRSSFQPCPAGLLRHSVRRCAALGVLVSFLLVLQRGRSFQKRSFHPPTPARPDSVKCRGISSRVYRTVNNAVQGPIPTAPSLCLLRLSSAPSTGGRRLHCNRNIMEHRRNVGRTVNDVRPSHPRAIRQVGSWAPARLTVTAVTVSRQRQIQMTWALLWSHCVGTGSCLKVIESAALIAKQCSRRERLNEAASRLLLRQGNPQVSCCETFIARASYAYVCRVQRCSPRLQAVDSSRKTLRGTEPTRNPCHPGVLVSTGGS